MLASFLSLGGPPMVAARTLPVGWKGVAPAAGGGAPRVSCPHTGLRVGVRPAAAAPSLAAVATVALGGGGGGSGSGCWVLASLLRHCVIVHAVAGPASLTARIPGAAACRRRTAAAVAVAVAGRTGGFATSTLLFYLGEPQHPGDVVGRTLTASGPASIASLGGVGGSVRAGGLVEVGWSAEGALGTKFISDYRMDVV